MASARMLPLLLVSLLAACAAEQGNSEYVRSPSLDYGRETPQTADGRPLGAVNTTPEDLLAQSASVGVNPDAKLAPGWSTEDGELRYDPEERTGSAFGASARQQRQTSTPVTNRRPAPTPAR